MRTSRIITITSGMTLAAVLAGGAAVAQSDDDVMSPMEDEMAVSVMEAWSRPSPMAEGIGVAYMRLVNTTEGDDALIGASSPAAGVVEMHQTTADSEGMMRMDPVENIQVLAGSETMLEPGGYHLMLVDLVEPLAEGGTVELSLEFETAGEVAVIAEILAMGGMPTDDMDMDDGDMDTDDMPMDDEGRDDDMPMDEPDASEPPADA